MGSTAISAQLLFFFFSFFVVSSSSFSSGGGGGGGEPVARESFPMAGDVAWVVQVSDLHLSVYHPERARDLVRLLAPALRVINPSLLLISGDLTDAKSKSQLTTRQDELEWIQYRNAVDAIASQSGMDKKRIFDIRGNHDKYGVPYVGHKLDFFSSYSVSAQLNRLSTIQSISLVGNDRKYVFLGMDDTLSIGIRGPSNLFGHPNDERINAVQTELQYSDDYPGALVTKVVFGHFPMSFTASSETGKRYESAFASQSVSTYICGHLHAKFSKQLWRFHSFDLVSDVRVARKAQNFWEWELGDWKDSRFMRILAIDGGFVSFLDIELDRHEVLEDFQTRIFITYPTDSRNMNGIQEINQTFRNDINALVFSARPIVNVTAKVFDSLQDFRIMEEIPLQPVSISAGQSPLYHAKWNAENYRSASAARYWLQVFVLDSQSGETASKLRPFSVEGNRAHHQRTLLAYLIFELQWEYLYSILLWSNVGFLVVFLSLPKLLNHFMKRNASYQRWALSVSVSSHVQQRKILFQVLWFLIEGSRSGKLWFAMVIYLLCLLELPWFWGRATSENGDIAGMYLSGWRMQAPNSLTMIDKLGTPDIMAITLPFMYLVVTPLIILVYSLSAESSATYLRSKAASAVSSDAQMPSMADSEQGSSAGASDEQMPLITESEQGSSVRAPFKSLKGTTVSAVRRLCGGWTRRSLLLVCLIISFVHLKLCSVLMLAYGVGPVALSPALLWAPLLLLAAAIYCTAITMDEKHT